MEECGEWRSVVSGGVWLEESGEWRSVVSGGVW